MLPLFFYCFWLFLGYFTDFYSGCFGTPGTRNICHVSDPKISWPHLCEPKAQLQPVSRTSVTIRSFKSVKVAGWHLSIFFKSKIFSVNCAVRGELFWLIGTSCNLGARQMCLCSTHSTGLSLAAILFSDHFLLASSRPSLRAWLRAKDLCLCLGHFWASLGPSLGHL
jgi:hypothetical protein